MSRAERFAEIVRKEIAEILQTKVHDKRLQQISLTGVDVSGDLSVARVYFSVWDETNFSVPKAKAAISAAAGFIRRELGSRIEARIVPQLQFIYDDSIKRGVALSKKISDIAKADAENAKRS